jgi:hypothetical protein
MPRLVGKRSNNGVFWSLAVLLLAIAGLGTLEYKGYTNLLPEMGGQGRPLVGEFGDS